MLDMTPNPVFNFKKNPSVTTESSGSQPARSGGKGGFALKEAALEVLAKQRTCASQAEYRYLCLPKKNIISKVVKTGHLWLPGNYIIFLFTPPKS